MAGKAAAGPADEVEGPSVGRFRTEGGTVLELGLPLSPEFAGQLRRHELVELGEDDAGEVVAVLRPARTDDKGAWVEYAVARGATQAEAQRLSRAQLVERFGA